MPLSGGCRCGDVRYTLDLDAPPPTYACHCRDCQTWSGTAFSQQALLAEGQLTVTAGTTTLFELPHPSGTRISRQYLCGRCHTRLYNSNTRRPGMIVVRAGTLDRSDELRVVLHIWTKRMQPWLTIADGVPSWPEMATPEAMAAALFPER